MSESISSKHVSYPSFSSDDSRTRKQLFISILYFCSIDSLYSVEFNAGMVVGRVAGCWVVVLSDFVVFLFLGFVLCISSRDDIDVGGVCTEF